MAAQGSALTTLRDVLHAHTYRPTGRTSSQEFARETLRRSILSGDLRPGTVLTQSRIAEALGMSTTPVREALRDLAGDGLIDIDRYTTTSVHQPTVVELAEVYDLRKVLETHAVRRIIERNDLEVLNRAADVQERMDREQDPAEWLLLNAEFHSELTRGAGSHRLSSILDSLRGSVAIYVGMAIRNRPFRIQESNVEHWQMIEACRAGDADHAIRLAEAHMDPPRDAVELELS